MERIPPQLFSFSVGENSELYIAILHAFAEANERLETSLSLDGLHERLRTVGWFGALDDADLTRALASLRDWRLVDVIQSQTENYRTAEEYERRNLQYSLTKRGEAAFAGVQHALTVLASSGALQTAVLDAIADRLGELHRLLTGLPVSDRKIYTALTELETHLDALRTNTKQFNGELQRLLRTENADHSTFREVKSATVAYLEEFLTNLDQRTEAIAAGITRVEAHGTAQLHQRALAGAELPPSTGDAAKADWLAHRRSRWAGLRAWFLPADGTQPRVADLHRVARRAIVTLLQVLDRISESRLRATSAVADFRALARWFAQAPTEHDLHRLYSAAFGLGSARHAHLGHPDPELVSASTAWDEAPPVPVSPLLRTAGRTEKIARTGRVPDVSAIKRERAERARAQRAELQRAWQELDTGGTVRLSAFAELDYATFERLLDLLGRALATAPDSSGARRATTADGRVEIALSPPRDSATATVRTPRGIFRGPDYLVTITAPGAGRGREEETA
ncbi:TIGR02677 family protein [Amycolatopsis acidicola]|uniref:TIGR02677 family protein n=1 Tax=Amycolatopsis acidicola TaxID=2596893 RepID=A0A5N0VAJ4_9PSEU|nr:TIGR02677 family protein [Amycolatopsis acidicola]KAA9161582.1 TIGR02677 family protein [Amycolatopsis acidicola]